MKEKDSPPTIVINKTDNKILFICYEDLCENDLVWDSIQSFIGINDTKDLKFIKSTKEIKSEFYSVYIFSCCCFTN